MRFGDKTVRSDPRGSTTDPNSEIIFRPQVPNQWAIYVGAIIFSALSAFLLHELLTQPFETDLAIAVGICVSFLAFFVFGPLLAVPRRIRIAERITVERYFRRPRSYEYSEIVDLGYDRIEFKSGWLGGWQNGNELVRIIKNRERKGKIPRLMVRGLLRERQFRQLFSGIAALLTFGVILILIRYFGPFSSDSLVIGLSPLLAPILVYAICNNLLERRFRKKADSDAP